MILSTSKAGIASSFKKFFTVLGYVIVSGGVAALIAYFSDYRVDAANALQVALIALVNAGLAAVAQWLKKVDPSERPVEV